MMDKSGEPEQALITTLVEHSGEQKIKSNIQIRPGLDRENSKPKASTIS